MTVPFDAPSVGKSVNPPKALSLGGEFINSFGYAALQHPYDGLRQFVNEFTGKEQLSARQIVTAPKDANFNSDPLRKSTQILGNALGMALPVFLVQATLRGTGRSILGALSPGLKIKPLLATSLGIGESAATGFIYEGLLRPVHPEQGEFWAARRANATFGALSFGSWSLAASGLKAYDSLRFNGSNGWKVNSFSADLNRNFWAGGFAGVVDIEARTSGNANLQEVLTSAGSFALIGAATRTLHETVASLTSPKHNQTATDIKSKTAFCLEPAADLQPEVLLGNETRTATSRHITTEYTRRLGGYRRESMLIEVPVEGEGKFKDYADYEFRGKGLLNLPVCVFRIKGLKDTELVVPRREFLQFQKLKALEYLQNNHHKINLTRYQGQRRQKLEDNFDKAANLQNQPQYEAMPPELAIGFIDKTPDASLVKRLVVLQKRHQDEPWLRQHYAEDIKVSGTADRHGEVRLYQPKLSDNAQEVLLHEWSHLFKYASGKEAMLFDKAARLEGSPICEFADQSSHAEEFWAELGRSWLGKHKLPERVTDYPLQTGLWMRSLRKRLESIHDRSAQQESLLNRSSLMEKELLSNGLETLVQHTGSADVKKRLQAIEILEHLGYKSQSNL